MRAIGLGRPTPQPIKLCSTDYLAMFTRFQFRTRIIESLNLFRSTFIQNTVLRIDATRSEIIRFKL